MDPIIGGALINGVGSLLGGLFGSKKGPSAGDQAYSHVGGIMQAAERFKFNPLTLLGAVNNVGQAADSPNYLGAAIADAGMMLADAVAERQSNLALKKMSALELANAKLKDDVKNLTLRPQVGGVYAQRQSVPSLAQALNRSDDNGPTAFASRSAVASLEAAAGGAPDIEHLNAEAVYHLEGGSQVRAANPDSADIDQFFLPYLLQMKHNYETYPERARALEVARIGEIRPERKPSGFEYEVRRLKDQQKRPRKWGFFDRYFSDFENPFPLNQF